jgi:hypothetical protein
MTVKLAILKSGETVISDIQEMVVDERVFGYLFNKPQIVLIKDFEIISKNNQEETKHSFDVNLYSWIPFTSDKQIRVPTDWVVTLVNPLPKLKNQYEENILNDGTKTAESDQSFSVDEQSYFSESD